MDMKELLQHAWYDAEHVKRNTIIQIVIATFAFILLCRVWPLGLVQRHTESVQQAFSHISEMQGESFSDTDKKLQTIRFTQKHINQIMVYLSCQEGYDANEDYVIFRLYDDGFSCIYEETQGFGLLEKRDGFLSTPDIDVDTDRDYYYEVIVPEEVVGSLLVPTAGRISLGQEENTILYVDGIYRDDISLVADFDYTKELTIFHIIGYDFLIIIMAVLCYIGIIWCFYTYEEYIKKTERYGKIALTGFVIFADIAFFVYAVIFNGFGGEAADRIVYGLASVGAMAWFWCAVWMSGKERKVSKLPVDRQVSSIWRNYIQTFSFALLFYALCQYVNADREYYHYTTTRWMLIFLGIAFLMIYTEKELLNYMSGIWLAISLIGSFIYCYGIEGEKESYLAKLAAAVVVVWGLVVIHTVRQIKKDFWKTIHWPFFVVWLVFVVFMWINRFDKVWVFVAVLPFLALLFMNLSAAGKSRLLKNFTNGILLNFGLVMLFCLMHRPYHYWMRYRYNGIFHTVACTGMYLTVVSGAIIGKLYGKWTDGKKLLQNGKLELFLLAAVVSNIMLSMSRTAILTLTVNFMLVMVLAAVSYRKAWKHIIAELCVVGVAVFISFPLIYSMVRVIPAVVNEPVRYEIEPQDRNYMIYEGDKADSDKYMTIRRYMTLFLFRFQTEEGEATNTIDVANDTEMLAYIGNKSLPVQLPSSQGDNIVLEKENDISNGRFDIYLDYLDRLTLKGHEKMAIEGEEYAHAHNSYLQVAYDFGLIAGVAFSVLCALTLWRSVVLAYCYGKNYSIFFVPFSLIVVFGFISLTEWAFHPCIPVGFAFLFMQMLLIQEPWRSKRKIRNAGEDMQTE